MTQTIKFVRSFQQKFSCLEAATDDNTSVLYKFKKFKRIATVEATEAFCLSRFLLL